MGAVDGGDCPSGVPHFHLCLPVLPASTCADCKCTCLPVLAQVASAPNAGRCGAGTGGGQARAARTSPAAHSACEAKYATMILISGNP